MPRKSNRQTVMGFYGYSQLELSTRVLGGVLRYRQENRGIALQTYLIDVFKTLSNEAPPVWQGQVDGVLLGAGIVNEPDELIDWLGSGGAPVVSMASNILDARLPAVIFDPESVVRLAMTELLRCQCQRLLYVGYAPSAGSRLRGDAFERAASKTGLPYARIESEWPFLGGSPEDVHENLALAKVLGEGPLPVGVHTLNDPIGRRVLRICQEQELRVPADVAIVAADDSPLAFEGRPTLTSVCYPGEEIGYRAAELLVGLIAGRRRPRKPIFVPATEIVVRETTGAAPNEDDVARALEIIHRKAHLGLKVHDLVESLDVSRRNLERAFQDRLGRTPGSEIRRLRMSRARVLLRESEFSIAHVAALVGYVEQASFIHAFQRDSGFSPTEFRQQPRVGHKK